jgi:hypothetical protein
VCAMSSGSGITTEITPVNELQMVRRGLPSGATSCEVETQTDDSAPLLRLQPVAPAPAPVPETNAKISETLEAAKGAQSAAQRVEAAIQEMWARAAAHATSLLKQRLRPCSAKQTSNGGDHMAELSSFIKKFATGEVKLKSVAKSEGAIARENARSIVKESPQAPRPRAEASRRSSGAGTPSLGTDACRRSPFLCSGRVLGPQRCRLREIHIQTNFSRFFLFF